MLNFGGVFKFEMEKFIWNSYLILWKAEKSFNSKYLSNNRVLLIFWRILINPFSIHKLLDCHGYCYYSYYIFETYIFQHVFSPAIFRTFSFFLCVLCLDSLQCIHLLLLSFFPYNNIIICLAGWHYHRYDY